MNEKVRFQNLSVPPKNRKKLLTAVDEVLEHGQLILGPEVEEFENKIANFCNKKFGVGVNSGTDALYLALRALDIGEGDEVITTCFSWIATANAIELTGATPVFADINDNLNIHPESIENLISPKTKAILPVHYGGLICNIKEIKNIAKQENIPVIEDASQAFGSKYKGTPAGSFGDLACFSLNPMKVYPACGEAGIVLTDDEELEERLEVLRYNGMEEKEKCLEPSHNGRIDTMQAAILLDRFQRVNETIKKRRKIAELYNKELNEVVETPTETTDSFNNYYSYIIKTPERDPLKKHLISYNIEVKDKDSCLMTKQPPYQNCIAQTKQAEKFVPKSLCLPIHKKLTIQEQKYVTQKIHGFFE